MKLSESARKVRDEPAHFVAKLLISGVRYVRVYDGCCATRGGRFDRNLGIFPQASGQAAPYLAPAGTLTDHPNRIDLLTAVENRPALHMRRDGDDGSRLVLV